MFYKIFSTIIIILTVILISIMFIYPKSKVVSNRSFNDLKDGKIVKLIVGNKELTTEIVNSSETTKQGLSDRDEIGSDGMLFIFPGKSMRNFWMYNMKFNLDFVWINGNKVVGITENVKNPNSSVDSNFDKNLENQNPEVVSVNKYTDKVLELNAGDIEKYDIEVGDTISLEDYGSNR